ncbi:hypothetical protein K438DRAFT_1195198 [Mycena galopus ATCC 62051]|nr:hypothetical protein K438DRAFT_1195198 [Mycena galopus ATCC 62051]
MQIERQVGWINVQGVRAVPPATKPFKNATVTAIRDRVVGPRACIARKQGQNKSRARSTPCAGHHPDAPLAPRSYMQFPVSSIARSSSPTSMFVGTPGSDLCCYSTCSPNAGALTPVSTSPALLQSPHSHAHASGCSAEVCSPGGGARAKVGKGST